MLNLIDVKSNVFTKGSIPANIYKSGTCKFLFKTLINPFNNDMKENVNNIELFVDDDFNITSGQIGKYDIDHGLRVIMF